MSFNFISNQRVIEKLEEYWESWKILWKIGRNTGILEIILRFWKKYWDIGGNTEILEDILRYCNKYWDFGRNFEI